VIVLLKVIWPLGEVEVAATLFAALNPSIANSPLTGKSEVVGAYPATRAWSRSLTPPTVPTEVTQSAQLSG